MENNNTLRLIPDSEIGELEKLVYDSQKVKAELDLLKRVIIRSLALWLGGLPIFGGGLR